MIEREPSRPWRAPGQAFERPGALVISLDFELHWGVRDHTSADAFCDRALATREVIPELLALFEAYGVHATWATVGILFADGRDEALAHAPKDRPRYADPRLDPYPELERAGQSEAEDPIHFAPSLIERIRATPHQEVGTHTFSHFYCLEAGQSAATFEADLRAANTIGGAALSLVLPRNQANPAYRDVLRDAGLTSVRTQGAHWAYRAQAGETAPRRAIRLVDAYVPATGARHEPWPSRTGLPIEQPASHFLRPYSKRLAALDDLRLRRLGADLEDAARSGRVFHLWWHPHNFGANASENLGFLEALLWRYERLRRQEGMQSLTMAEVSEAVAAPAQTVSESA